MSRQAVPEDGCNWKRTSADGSYRRYAGTCSRCDEDERRRITMTTKQADQQHELADPRMAETL